MRKYSFTITIFILMVGFTSCVTQKQCIKKNNLCGIVVDENNKPVSDYLIICSSNPFNKLSTYTNSSGVFVLSDLDIGTYNISGKKQNYGEINNKDFYFDGGSSMLCFQVSSLQELLCKTDKYIENKEYEKALNIINEISVYNNYYNSALVLLYKEYLYIKIKNMDGYIECINQLRKIKNDKLREFIKKGDVGL